MFRHPEGPCLVSRVGGRLPRHVRKLVGDMVAIDALAVDQIAVEILVELALAAKINVIDIEIKKLNPLKRSARICFEIAVPDLQNTGEILYLENIAVTVASVIAFGHQTGHLVIGKAVVVVISSIAGACRFVIIQL